MILKLIPMMLELQRKIYSLIYGHDFTKEDASSIMGGASSCSKRYFTKTESLVLKSQTTKKAQDTTKIATEILKKYINKPKNLLAFIQSKGTKVVVGKNIDLILNLISEEEGFITPLSGSKALFLSIMINLLSKNKVAIGFKTPEMFILRSFDVNIYSLAHHFYHWLAFRKKMPGYEPETVSSFKNVWRFDSKPETIQALSVNQILSLKDAIERDTEAIDFVKAFAREHVGSKKSLSKLKQGHAVNL